MAKLSVFLVTLFICSALEAVVGYPGYFLSPVPPPPPPPPPFPAFHTRNWSGIARSSDGRSQGVFSGAAAAAESGQNTGEALSLASSSVGNSGVQSDGCDEGQTNQNGAEAGSAANSQSIGGSGQFGEESNQFGSYNGPNQGGHSTNGGKSVQNANAGGVPSINGGGYGFGSVKKFKEAHYSFKTEGGQDVNGQAGLTGQSQSSAFGGSDAGSNNFQSESQSGYSGSEAKIPFGGHSNADNAGLINSNDNTQFPENQGFGQVGYFDDHKNQASQQQNERLSEQNTGKGFTQHKDHGSNFGEQSQQAGGFGGSSSNSQASANIQGSQFLAKPYQTYQNGPGLGNAHGQGFEKQYGQANAFGRSKYQADSNTGNTQQQTELGSGSFSSGSNAANSGHRDALGGALSLASQSLDSAQKAGCSTCGGKGGYALSNARSHSGSAIAVSIGG